MRKQIISVFIALIISAFLPVLSSCGLISGNDRVIKSLGKYDSIEYYRNGGFQDFTDYAKYFFDECELAQNEYFEPITTENMDTLNAYIDHFEQWIDAKKESDAQSDLVLNYDFDRSIIDNDDYICIQDRMGEPIGDSVYKQFEDYQVYFFDVQSNTLYYFHNNI